MPRKTKYEYVTGRYFAWRLCIRDGIYYADGRTNDPSPGRHSLGTRDYNAALTEVRKLDLVQAVELGLAKPSELDAHDANRLQLDQGRQLYLEHVGRPRVTGGVRAKTKSRYKAVFDKFVPFTITKGIVSWNDVTARLLERYAAHLDGEGYAYRTEFLELTTIKQATNWLIGAGYLPEACRIRLRLPRPTGTDTYCYTEEEVASIISRCREIPELDWLGNIATALACTGMRISELASLRWSDIDFASNMIKLTDDTARAVSRGGQPGRQIKNHCGRSFPIHPDLYRVLEPLPRHSDGRVFHGPRGGVISPDQVRRTLIRDVLAPLGKTFPTPAGEIGFGHGRLHSFRHYFCSVCANSGTPEQVVMRWLGHRDSQMVRYYYHLHDEEAQRQMKRIDFVGRTGATVAPAPPQKPTEGADSEAG